jgi:hypothetical protein
MRDDSRAWDYLLVAIMLLTVLAWIRFPITTAISTAISFTSIWAYVLLSAPPDPTGSSASTRTDSRSWRSVGMAKPHRMPILPTSLQRGTAGDEALYPPDDDPNSLASRLRRKQAERLRPMIVLVSAMNWTCSILDIGGEASYWQTAIGLDDLREWRVHITLLNHTDKYVGTDLDPALFTVVIADGCQLPFADGSFDIAHSSSTIEHVGDWQRREAFAREIRRVARRYFVQTPAFGFPLEPHYRFPYFQMLPEPARIWMLQHFALGTFPLAEDLPHAIRFSGDVRLLSRNQFTLLFPDAIIERERFLGLTKLLMAVRK